MKLSVGLIAIGALLAIFSFYGITRYAPCPAGQPCPSGAFDPFWLAAGTALVVLGSLRAFVDRRSRVIHRR